MDELTNEKPLNELLRADDHDRKIVPVKDTRWGELIIPAKHENLHKTNEGLRTLVVASYDYGYILMETLKECERRFPNRLNIVGLVTDDPANPDAKISAKKRIWRMYDEEEKLDEEKTVIESALSFGVPCYTGEIKTDFFSRLLAEWNPEAIVVFVFGQFFNETIINFPKLGIYNFHPTDLANHYGAGPQPFMDMIDRKADTSKLTIHQISTQVDAGKIVGQSPSINIQLKDGKHTENVLVLEQKLAEPIKNMAAKLISELILKKEAGLSGKIDSINFVECFSDKEKGQMMRPIQSNNFRKTIPVISDNLDFFDRH